MAKFASARPAPPQTPIRSTFQVPDAVTHEGGAGYTRDAKSELFLLAVSNMVGEKTFYEDAGQRDARFEALIHQVTAEDPDWVRRFVPWLRTGANMRSASIVAACEYVKAGGPNGRHVVAAACQRPDEPAEAIGYWLATHGRKIPQPVKRGVADAVARLYNERAFLKYDSQRSKVRMGDIIDLVHPTPTTPWQSVLFHHILDDRHHPGGEIPTQLAVLQADATLLMQPAETRRALLREDPSALDRAGWTWERLAGWLPGGMDAEAWEFAIPYMGAMALVRNLRNFDDAGIGDDAVQHVETILRDPHAIHRSRMFPVRMYQAWKAVQTVRWGPALEAAIHSSLANVPTLKGRTLVMVDVSGSMADKMAGRSELKRWEVAAVFGAALSSSAEHADLVPYHTQPFTVSGRGSILRLVEGIGHLVGGDTETWACTREKYAGHDRIVILTDEQAFGSGWGLRGGTHADLPADVPIYTFNLAGYRSGHAPSGGQNRYTFGGLSDAAFSMLEALEARRDGSWPF